MSKLAIIPARGGSKRILRKNIRDFLGKPIMAYSIETALKSSLFDEVMVSTDSQEIADVARDYGANIPFIRSKETADDYAPTLSVIHEVLSKYKKRFQKAYDFVCCIYPTAPLIQIKHLRNGFDLLVSRQFDSVFPLVKFSYPIWRGVKINQDGKAHMVWPEYQNARSQDLENIYHDAGQWYWLNPLRLKDSILTENSGCIILREEEAQDIDNKSDWELAELKYRLINES